MAETSPAADEKGGGRKTRGMRAEMAETAAATDKKEGAIRQHCAGK